MSGGHLEENLAALARLGADLRRPHRGEHLGTQPDRTERSQEHPDQERPRQQAPPVQRSSSRTI